MANIVYIFSDQHRGDTLGCVGHPAVITPNLDKLAAEGVIFTHCFTNSPVCMPARASMMSGQYVCEHGVWFNDNAADPLGPSHVRNIRDAGYHTALIGKTHLWVHGGNILNVDITATRPHTKEKIQILKDWGFIDIHEVTGPIASVMHDSPYTDYIKEKGLLKVFRDYMINYTLKWAAGRAKPWDEPPSPVPAEDHLDSYIGRRAIEWIQHYNSEKPFYLQILFPGPHDPFDSPLEYRDMYKPVEMPVGILEWPQKPIPPYVSRVLHWSGIKNMTPAQNQLLRTFYYAKITLIDEYIGRIIKILKEKNLLENTWIIYNSDHGEMLGDHMMNHKVVFYEGALHIPCIIRPPGGTKHWKCHGLTDHLDITTSLINIADAKPLKGSDGRSLIPQVLNGPNDAEAQKGKEVIFSEVTGFSMARNGRYKMAISSKRRKPFELFDLKEDPKELKNLVKEPTYESVRQELLDKYLNKFLDKHMKNI